MSSVEYKAQLWDQVSAFVTYQDQKARPGDSMMSDSDILDRVIGVLRDHVLRQGLEDRVPGFVKAAQLERKLADYSRALDFMSQRIDELEEQMRRVPDVMGQMLAKHIGGAR